MYSYYQKMIIHILSLLYGCMSNHGISFHAYSGTSYQVKVYTRRARY